MSIISTIPIQYEITKFVFDGTGPSAQITFTSGFMRDADYIPLSTETIDVDTTDTITAMMQVPEGASLYDAMKSALSKYLVNKGIVAGTIG